MAVQIKGDYDGDRRIGSTRPTALMFTAGVGAIVELPHLTVIVRGLDAWDDRNADEVSEPRLLAAVQQSVGQQVERMLAPPHAPEDLSDPTGRWSRVGVPVMPFPRWLRCTKCDYLGTMDSTQFTLDPFSQNVDLSRFLHVNCQRSTNNRGGVAVSARFVFACDHGHLDDFPYAYFVHDGSPCAQPRYEMKDFGRGMGPNVEVRCTSCQKNKLMIRAFGEAAPTRLPACRGRNPQLGTFDAEPCRAKPRAMVLGASNLWFSQVLTSLYLPHEGGDLLTRVQAHWSKFTGIDDSALDAVLGYAIPQDPDLADLRDYGVTSVKNAILSLRNPPDAPVGEIDLKAPEWAAFTAHQSGLAPGDSDFRIKVTKLPAIAPDIGLQQVVLVERLRAAKAFTGFTRIGTRDPGDTQSPYKRGAMVTHNQPRWVPAVDARGEGIFLRFNEDFIAAWEQRCQANGTLSNLLNTHRERNRGFGLTGAHEYRGWITDRGVLLHTFSHLLIRRLALDCGYSAQSLAERIYYGTPDDPNAGILIYTTAADSEGTLGGLVSLGQANRLDGLIRGALRDAARCSADPLCGEHKPNADHWQLHGAACHLCAFASETSCEFGNKYLDRATLANVGDCPTPLTDLVP